MKQFINSSLYEFSNSRIIINNVLKCTGKGILKIINSKNCTIHLVTHSFADSLVELCKVVLGHVTGAVAGHVHSVFHVSIPRDLLLDDVRDT